MFDLKEVHVDKAFAPAAKIDWLKRCVDPNTMVGKSDTIFPTKHIPLNIGQKPIGRQGYLPLETKVSPWFYGETPDFVRLVGNAACGHGS